MKRILIISAALVAMIGISERAFAWGRDGHAIVAYIAEQNLTPTAKANVEKCLDNHSIVYYASWLDYHRKTYRAWDHRAHTCDFDEETLKPMGKAPKHMKETLRLLSDWRNLPDSVLKFNLYSLIHTMGDYHCPGHTVLKKKNENGKWEISKYSSTYKAYILDEKEPTKYHKFWDGGVVLYNHADWGYTDYYNNVARDVPQEKKDAIVAGTLEDWLTDSARNSIIIYEKVPAPATKEDPAPVITRELCNQFDELACEQMLKAGLRLAKVLNDRFGE